MSTVDHGVDRTLEGEPTRDILDIGGDDIPLLESSLPTLEVFRLDQPAQILDRLPVERAIPEHHLDPIVLGWIVRPGDLEPPLRPQVDCGEVWERARDG